jgi:hypothetical protein
MADQQREPSVVEPIAITPSGEFVAELACVYYPAPTESGHVEIPGDERAVIAGPAFSRAMFERAFAALTEGSNGLATAPVAVSTARGGGSVL